MKRILSVFVLIFVLSFNAISIFANDIMVMLDGQYVDVTTPVIIDGSSLLPARDIIELLGGSVEWNGEKRQITMLKGDINILLAIDNTTAYVNGSAVELDVPAQIINDKTMIPLRFVASSMGVDVGFADGVIIISTVPENETKSTGITPTPPPIATPDTNSKYVVYWGHTGDKIHISSTCRTIKNGVLSGSLDEAKAAGHTNGWCGVCSKGWTDDMLLNN